MAICRRTVTVVIATAAALLGAATVASATTGPGYLLKHPGFKVTTKEAKPYLGIWRFKPSGSSSQLVDASMVSFIGTEPQNYMIGQIQVYVYDKTGQEGDWTATCFNWRWTGSQMETELVGFTGTPLIGYMVLKAEKDHTLQGSIVTVQGAKYAVAFTRTSLEKNPTVGSSPFKKKSKK